MKKINNLSINPYNSSTIKTLDYSKLYSDTEIVNNISVEDTDVYSDSDSDNETYSEDNYIEIYFLLENTSKYYIKKLIKYMKYDDYDDLINKIDDTVDDMITDDTDDNEYIPGYHIYRYPNYIITKLIDFTATYLKYKLKNTRLIVTNHVYGNKLPYLTYRMKTVLNPNYSP